MVACCGWDEGGLFFDVIGVRCCVGLTVVILSGVSVIVVLV